MKKLLFFLIASIGISYAVLSYNTHFLNSPSQPIHKESLLIDDYAKLLTNTQWQLQDYLIAETTSRLTESQLAERRKEFEPDFPKGETFFEFSEEQAFRFEIKDKEEINGHWTIDEEVFTIMATEEDCQGCNVNLAFQLIKITEEELHLQFSQEEYELNFTFTLVFIKM